MGCLLENSILEIINKYDKFLLQKYSIIGVGMGYKVKSGINTKEPCLHISVKKKLNLDELRPLDVIPKTFLGIKTDIVEDEELKVFNSEGTGTMGANNLNLNSKIRPVQPGTSIAPSGKGYSGTLGCIVFSNKDNKAYALSCNHVLADNNSLNKAHLILQPASIYGGNSFDNVIAVLINYIEIKFGNEINYFDAAIAQIIKPYNEYIPNIGLVKDVDIPKIDDIVKKTGAMTNYSEGKILASSYSAFIKINGSNVLFKDQIKASKMSEIGDSGSLVVNRSNKAIGMIISGGQTQTAITPINSILEYFDVHL